MKKTDMDFTFLIMDSSDNTSAMKHVENSKNFFCYKLHYALPYEVYNGIKKFQLAYHRTGMFCKNNVSAIIDISEWVGHSEEEFFDITLKFLYDHRADIKYIFVANGFSYEECVPLYIKLRCYMNGTLEKDKTFETSLNLSEYLKNNFSLAENEAILLSELLTENEMKILRNYPAIESLINGLKTYSGCKAITMSSTADYLKDKNSLVAMISEPIAEKYAVLATKSDKHKVKVAG